jgi:hypothetical protein
MGPLAAAAGCLKVKLVKQCDPRCISVDVQKTGCQTAWYPLGVGGVSVCGCVAYVPHGLFRLLAMNRRVSRWVRLTELSLSRIDIMMYQ